MMRTRCKIKCPCNGDEFCRIQKIPRINPDSSGIQRRVELYIYEYVATDSIDPGIDTKKSLKPVQP